MTALRDAYPPVGKPVRLYRDGVDFGQWTMVEWGPGITHFYWWKPDSNINGVTFIPSDEVNDAWEAV